MPTITFQDPGDEGLLIPTPGPGKAIQLVSWEVTVDGSATVTFVAGGILWGTVATTVAGGGIVVPYSPARLLQAPVDTAVTLGLSDAVGAWGSIDYNEVDVLS